MASTMASPCRAGAARAALAGLALLLAWGSFVAPQARAAAEPVAAGAGPADAGSAQGTADPAGPEAAAGTAAASAAAPAGTSDPVIGEVLRMLRGGVASPVVVAWLDKSGKRPAVVGSGDLVALHQAGASDELLKKLIQLAGGVGAKAAPSAAAPATAAPAASARPANDRAAAPTSAAGGAAAPGSPASAAGAGPVAAAPGTAPSTPGPPSQAPGTTGGAGSSAATVSAMPAQPPDTVASPVAGTGTAVSAAAPGMVKTRFAVIYRPVSVDAEPQLSEPWWLLLYVDGRCVASVKPESALLPFPPRTFDHELAPGKHLLRVTQERPLHRTGHGYTSLSRIDPSELAFVLEPGVDALVHVRYNEKSFRHPGPIAVRIEQQGRATARLEPPAPDPEAWPPLCEDIPAALAPGAKLPSAARKELAKCVQWAALWPGMAAVPPRDEVRGEAARMAAGPPAVP
jgi:hypothetical protein